MASISKRPNGRRLIQFTGADGKRRTIRLGKAPQRTAEEIRVKVEHLVAAQLSGLALDAETARWLGQIGAELAGKLAAAGLMPDRPESSLGPFLTGYVERRTDVKSRTRDRMRTAAEQLLEFFGPGKPLREITPAEADAWLVSLKTAGYAEGTIGRRVKYAKQFFRAALRARLIAENPFEELKSGNQSNPERLFFVTREMAQKVLAACPDAQWRLLFALSRYGGLRCPSEHLALTWADVDWAGGKVRIDSPKTGERWIPLFPELRPYLEEVFERAEPGTVKVITLKKDANSNLRTRLLKIIRRAGLVPWPKLFQNLRASRETELAETFPLHVVCKWIGNSAPVAARHYLQVTEEHFRQAGEGTSGSAAKSDAATARNPPQPLVSEAEPVSTTTAGYEGLRTVTDIDDIEEYAWRDSNPQPTAP